jgi:hypothetical protein
LEGLWEKPKLLLRVLNNLPKLLRIFRVWILKDRLLMLDIILKMNSQKIKKSKNMVIKTLKVKEIFQDIIIEIDLERIILDLREINLGIIMIEEVQEIEEIMDLRIDHKNSNQKDSIIIEKIIEEIKNKIKIIYLILINFGGIYNGNLIRKVC